MTNSSQFREIKSATQVHTPPALEPVLVSELMDQANVDINDQPELMMGHIAAARTLVEKDTERCLMPQTLKLYIDRFPTCAIHLERPPVSSVESIEYYDVAGTLQTLDPSSYELDLVSEPCRIVPAYGKVWPFTRPRTNAVIVTYVAGYSSAEAVPEVAKLAIKLLAAHWYKNREATAAGQVPQEMAMAYSSLIAGLKWRAYV